MKQLHGRASSTVSASPERCVELFAGIEGYARWCPELVRGVEVLELDAVGLPLRAFATLHVAYGPLAHDFRPTLVVARESMRVSIARVPHDDRDPERFTVEWTIAGAGDGVTTIALELDALLDVPRFLPLRGIGEAMAGKFLAAAVAALGEPPDA